MPSSAVAPGAVLSARKAEQVVLIRELEAKKET